MGRYCPKCKKEVLTSEHSEKIDSKLYKTERCRDCGFLFRKYRTNEIKIPMKPLTEGEKSLTSLLWLLTWILLIASFFVNEVFLLFLIILALYNLIHLQSNIGDAFQNHLRNGLKYLPIAIGIQLVGETLLEISRIEFFKTVISFWALGSLSNISNGEINPIAFFFAFIFILLLCLTFNYLEEYYFRDRYWKVAIWCLLHLVLGLSTFNIGNFIILCFMGILFKYVYDKHSVQEAYITHFFTNVASLLIVLISHLW